MVTQCGADVEIMKDFESSVLLPKPPFSLGSPVCAQAWPLFGGLALFTSGRSILAWLFCQTKQAGRIGEDRAWNG